MKEIERVGKGMMWLNVEKVVGKCRESGGKMWGSSRDFGKIFLETEKTMEH